MRRLDAGLWICDQMTVIRRRQRDGLSVGKSLFND